MAMGSWFLKKKKYLPYFYILKQEFDVSINLKIIQRQKSWCSLYVCQHIKNARDCLFVCLIICLFVCLLLYIPVNSCGCIVTLPQFHGMFTQYCDVTTSEMCYKMFLSK